MSPTAEALKNILVKIKSDPELFQRVADDAHLLNEVGLDSIEMLQFMLEIEASLSVRIDFDKLQYSSLRSIHTLAEFLDTQRA